MRNIESQGTVVEIPHNYQIPFNEDPDDKSKTKIIGKKKNKGEGVIAHEAMTDEEFAAVIAKGEKKAL